MTASATLIPEVHIAVISSGRPGQVAVMNEHLGGDHATWYVKPGEEDEYRAAGAARVVGAVDGLCGARNAALDDAFAARYHCVQLSDDLKKVRRALDKKRADPLTVEQAIRAMKAELTRSGARLAGAAPTDNPFYFNPNAPVRTEHFIVGDFLVIAPSEVRFDLRLRLKEDYGFTIDHVQRFGKVARCDFILATFQHYSNPGGAVAVRTTELEQEMIALLKAKYPAWIKDNPRRPNEVLLKAPAHRKA